MLLACPSMVAGSLAHDRKTELLNVRSKIATADQNLERLRAQQHKMQQQLAEIDKKYAAMATAIKDFQQQIDDNKRLISDTEQAIKRQTRLVDTQRDSLNKQMQASYIIGRQERLKLLFNHKDPALSSRLLVYYGYLNKMRLRHMALLEDNIHQLAELEGEHENELLRLQALQRDKQAEQSALVALKQKRMQLLASLNKQVVSGKWALTQLRENEQQLKSLLGGLSNEVDFSLQRSENSDKAAVIPSGNKAFNAAAGKSFASLRGSLPWPVAGRALKRFGNPKLDGRWNGVLIGAPEGRPVRAVANGKVAYSGWFKGYGMLTIINHGSGFMTIYAFNQSLYKRVGSHVRAGDIIAAVGQSGGQTETGVYFEIRKQGNPLNPNLWCKK